MSDIRIRRVDLSDIDRLQAIGRETFAETFSRWNTAENLDNYLKEGFGRAKLAAELNTEESRFYFAELDGDAIGYLKVNAGRSQTELQDEKALEIERIYVLKAHQGRKVGQLLHDKAIAVAKQLKAGYVWLGVWENNPKAIGFYRKNGFIEFGKHLFKLGADEQVDLLMRRELEG
ncbi:MAG: GNAT family N-acetyltransferase [Flavobacteriales bacterium]